MGFAEAPHQTAGSGAAEALNSCHNWRSRPPRRHQPLRQPCSQQHTLAHALPRTSSRLERRGRTCAQQRQRVSAGWFVDRHGVGAALGVGDELPADPATLAALAYVRGSTEQPLLEETIGQALERVAAAQGDSQALVSVHQGISLTYAELLTAVREVAQGLLALGVQAQERVGIWSPTCAEWLVLQYAAAFTGAILVNLNPAYSSSDLQNALNQCGVSVLVLAPELRGTSFVGMVEALQQGGKVPGLKHKVVLGEGRLAGCLSWEELRQAGQGEGLAAALDRRKAELRPEDPIDLQCTSGTTGFPKAVALSHRNLLNNAFFIGQACKYTAADRICIPVPLFHCFGFVIGNLAALAHGCTAVYPSATFSPEAALRAVEQEGCTSLYGVPAMFIQYLEHPHFQRYHLDSLRTGVMAGSPCPVEVMRRVQRDMHMREITICYGMTETSPVSFQSSTDDPVERRVSTVGRVHPHLEAKVVDPQSGRLLPRGAVGELCVRGYSVMLGYWGDEAATAAVKSQDGWMRTGDLATLDDEGYCNIMGRQKDMVIRAGENISPREVEEFLHGHPAIADVQVFGIPDVKRGEALCAWVILRDAHRGQVDASELRAWCQGRIAGYKIPRHWRTVDAFPMTLSGKPQKFRMREAMVKELGLEQAAAVRTA